MWDRWTEAILETKVPYGYTLGNHDSEADLNRREIVELDSTSPYSFTRLPPEGVDGASNFVVPVYSSKNPDEVVMNLWFFDSGDYDCLKVKGYGCVDHSAINWYRAKSDELSISQNGRKPGVAFMHIAPQEYMFAYDVCYHICISSFSNLEFLIHSHLALQLHRKEERGFGLFINEYGYHFCLQRNVILFTSL